MVSNDNATDAVGWLKQDPTATVSWTSATGQVVSRTQAPIHLDVAVKPGITVQPLMLSAPETAGQYRLTVDWPGKSEPFTQSVTVSNGVPAATGAALILSKVDIQPGPYRPGDSLHVRLVWLVAAQPTKELTVTAQLLDPNNNLVGQHDQLPFGTTLPTDRWIPGTVIAEPLSIPIPPNVTTGQFRLLIAMYDASGPPYPRTAIRLPNGTTDSQYLSDLMTVTHPGQ